MKNKDLFGAILAHLSQITLASLELYGIDQQEPSFVCSETSLLREVAEEAFAQIIPHQNHPSHRVDLTLKTIPPQTPSIIRIPYQFDSAQQPLCSYY